MKMIDQMKVVYLEIREPGKRFVIYMHMTGSYDSGTDTIE